MEKENNKKKKNIVGIIVLIVSILLLVGLLLWNSLKDDKEMSTVEYEAQQLSLFKGDIEDFLDGLDSSGMSPEETAYLISSWLSENIPLYDSESVSLAGMQLFSILGKPFTAVGDLLGGVSSLLEGLDVTSLLGGLLGGGNEKATRTITMKSNTVCQSVSDSKYCVDKLSANVYITDVKSSKWAVLVHPFMTSGSLIYNAIGGMYKDQGYNVIAPDLRGFGNSDGSVAMGYLESLDIYDWIKDLNTNWSNANRYGVRVAPDTIIVHGISLGGATTLQLATNPDIAAASGSEPYSKNLKQLNVKGFVDDCGYTSMSGIVTGMLGGGNTVSISSLLSSLGIKDVDFMAELQDILKKYNVPGFDFNFINGSILERFKNVKSFTDQFKNFLGAFSATMGGSGTGGTDSGTSGSGSTGNGNPFLDPDGIKDWIDKFKEFLSGGIPFQQSNISGNVVATPVENYLGDPIEPETLSTLDELVGTVLMKLVGVGLTEENYAKYSLVFSEGREFPAGTKVAVIHGTADTTVPFSNANNVARRVHPAKLVEKWEVSGAPHVFVVVGSKTDEYKEFVAKYTACVEQNCDNIHKVLYN